MTTTIHAVFDGTVFKPEERIDFQPNQRYVLSIIPANESQAQPKNQALARILARAADLGVSDLAEHHDDYLHGMKPL